MIYLYVIFGQNLEADTQQQLLYASTNGKAIY